ncbi:hypothetical protein ABIA33_006859, partial [Streptacidiphilus sp. MAP12-16]
MHLPVLSVLVGNAVSPLTGGQGAYCQWLFGGVLLSHRVPPAV